jgi:hypothetical protein
MRGDTPCTGERRCDVPTGGRRRRRDPPPARTPPRGRCPRRVLAATRRAGCSPMNAQPSRAEPAQVRARDRSSARSGGTCRPAVVRLWREYLAERGDGARRPAFWPAADRRRTPDPDPALAAEGYTAGASAQCHARVGAPTRRRRRVAVGAPHGIRRRRQSDAPGVLAMERVQAVREGDGLALHHPSGVETAGWRRARLDRLEYVVHPALRFNVRRTAETARRVEATARRFGVADRAPITYYQVPDLEAACRVMGLDWALSADRVGRRANPGARAVFAADPRFGEASRHEFAPVRRAPVLHAPWLGGASAFVGEGIASWLGGARGRPFPEMTRDRVSVLARQPALGPVGILASDAAPAAASPRLPAAARGCGGDRAGAPPRRPRRGAWWRRRAAARRPSTRSPTCSGCGRRRSTRRGGRWCRHTPARGSADRRRGLARRRCRAVCRSHAAGGFGREGRLPARRRGRGPPSSTDHRRPSSRAERHRRRTVSRRGRAPADDAHATGLAVHLEGRDVARCRGRVIRLDDDERPPVVRRGAVRVDGTTRRRRTTRDLRDAGAGEGRARRGGSAGSAIHFRAARALALAAVVGSRRSVAPRGGPPVTRPVHLEGGLRCRSRRRGARGA